jgi:hypothetical protein
MLGVPLAFLSKEHRSKSVAYFFISPKYEQDNWFLCPST